MGRLVGLVEGALVGGSDGEALGANVGNELGGASLLTRYATDLAFREPASTSNAMHGYTVPSAATSFSLASAAVLATPASTSVAWRVR